MEADLWRSEAKIAALAKPEVAGEMRYWVNERGEIVAERRDDDDDDDDDGEDEGEKGKRKEMTKAEGMQRWRKEMELRFVRGEDTDFDYGEVDGRDVYDDWGTEAREEEEKWFEEEEPRWVDDGEEIEIKGNPDDGETGIQDF